MAPFSRRNTGKPLRRARLGRGTVGILGVVMAFAVIAAAGTGLAGAAAKARLAKQNPLPAG